MSWAMSDSERRKRKLEMDTILRELQDAARAAGKFVRKLPSPAGASVATGIEKHFAELTSFTAADSIRARGMGVRL